MSPMSPSRETPPRAGILIPTYNRVDLLRESLGSARDQTCRDVEILVIDNGSADGTAAFMESVGDARVRYVVNPENIGIGGSVNRGVRLFPPDVAWITVLADDDLLDPDYVRAALACVASTGARSVVDGHRLFIDGGGRKIRDANRPALETSAFGYIRSRARFRRESYLTGVLFSRAAFEKAGGYPVFSTGAGTDDAFIFALALLDRLHHAPSAVARVRIHSDAESRNASRALEHLKSTSELEAYVLAKAEGSGLIDRRELDSLRKWMRRYAAMTNDLHWNRRAASAAVDDGPARSAGVADLCAVAREGKYPFTARTRVNAYLLERAGLFLESRLPYRTFWRLVKLLNVARMGWR